MRLLKTKGETLKLVSINDKEAQEAGYAILSHRWLAEEEEVTFRDIKTGVGKEKKGWDKLLGCRRQASLDGFGYIWVDTCCIDKSSSQELNEAINAMFKWYQNAGVCYAYLHDVPDLGPASRTYPRHQTALQGPAYSQGGAVHPTTRQAFAQSSWFKRGWTLQEMIAPKTVHFYNQSWRLIASLGNLVDVVAKITGVHRECLSKDRPVDSYSIAQRMSWASSREVTQVEDGAYSLLGIMGVNMSALYGEGENAFLRLQEELLRKSSDDSIFVWGAQAGPVDGRMSSTSLIPGQLLASSPNDFRDSGNIAYRSNSGAARYRNTGKEVDFEMLVVDIFPSRSTASPRNWSDPKLIYRLAVLGCAPENDPTKVLALLLCAQSDRKDRFFVSGPSRWQLIDLRKGLRAQTPFPGYATRLTLKAFHVVHNPGKRSVIATKSVLCRPQAGLSLRPTAASDTDRWVEASRAIMFPQDLTDMEKLRFAIAVTPGHYDTLELHIHQHPWRVAFVSAPSSRSGGEWRERVSLKQISFRWHHKQVVIARLSNPDPKLERSDLVFLDVHCVGAVRGLGQVLSAWIPVASERAKIIAGTTKYWLNERLADLFGAQPSQHRESNFAWI